MKLRPIFTTFLVASLIVSSFFIGRSSNPKPISQQWEPESFSPQAVNTPNNTLPLEAKYPPPNDRNPSFDVRKHLIRLKKGQLPYDVAIQQYVQRLKGITLSSEQIEQLQDVYSAIYEARINYEISKARVSILGSNQMVIEIPTYPAFGRELEKTTASMFRTILGKSLADDVLSQIGDQIEVSNLNWGECTQTVFAEYDSRANSFKITHSIFTESPSGTPVLGKETEGVYEPTAMGSYSKFLPILQNLSSK